MFFEERERNDTTRRLPEESSYEYLNRAKGSVFTWTRKIIEDFLQKYPMEEKPRIIKDLKSKEDYDFLSAFFEIYLYNLMLCLGANEIVIHPSLPSGNTKPDFLIKFPNSCEFYLEAKLIYQSPLMSKNKKLLTQLKAEIDKAFKGTRYNFHIHAVQGEMDNSLSFRKISQDLFSWVQTLHRKKIIRVQYKKSKPPKKTIGNQKWSIEIEAFILRKGKTVQESAIQLAFFDPSGGNNPYKIISQKVKHYKDIDKPFIMAINDISIWSIDYHYLFNLLFGQESMTFYQNNKQSQWTRLANGLWTKPGCKHKRLSAILFTGGLMPYNCSDKDIVLIHHPEATHKLTDSPLHQLTHWLVEDNNLKKIAGAHPSALLNLPEMTED